MSNWLKRSDIIVRTTKEPLVGTRSWNCDSWANEFYPEELPLDWRFCYYSNALRSVSVPSQIWESAARPEVGQWVEDSDTDFHFVLEPPITLCRPPSHIDPGGELEAFLDRITSIRQQTSGYFCACRRTYNPMWSVSNAPWRGLASCCRCASIGPQDCQVTPRR